VPGVGLRRQRSVAASSSQAAAAKPAATSVAAPPSSPALVPGAVVVGGLVPAPSVFHIADLQQMPAEVQQVSFSAGGQPEQHTFRGTRLINVLNASNVQFDPVRKNAQLRAYVLVTASDGYQAVVSYGDLAPGVGDRPILLAYEQDGKAFTDKDGPRLVVPGDKSGGRYVSGVVRVEVRDAENAPFVASSGAPSAQPKAGAGAAAGTGSGASAAGRSAEAAAAS